MKRILFALFLAPAFFLLMAGNVQAQGPDGAFRIKETREKTIVYEIKVTGADNAGLAQFLDQKMKEKMGVVSCSTNPSTGICTIEASKALTTGSLKQSITANGYDVAKTF